MAQSLDDREISILVVVVLSNNRDGHIKGQSVHFLSERGPIFEVGLRDERIEDTEPFGDLLAKVLALEQDWDVENVWNIVNRDYALFFDLGEHG